MKNKKQTLIWALIIIVALIVYNLCVFTIASNYTNAFWASYVFTTVAFLSQLVVGSVLINSANDVGFLGLPLIHIGGVYFVVQLVAGMVCMMAPIPFGFAAIVQVIILSAYIIAALFVSLAKNSVINTDVHIKEATGFIRNLTIEAEHLYLSEENESKKSELKKLYEAIRYSDPMSSTKEICMLDEQISAALRTVNNIASTGTVDDLKREVKYALDLVAKRNLLCKSSK